jgi:hypothetical protein
VLDQQGIAIPALTPGLSAIPPQTSHLNTPEKIALFRSLLRGREDAYARSWDTRGRKAHQQYQRYRDCAREPMTDQTGVVSVSSPLLVATPPVCTCVVYKRQGRWFGISPGIPGEWRRQRQSKQQRGPFVGVMENTTVQVIVTWQ